MKSISILLHLSIALLLTILTQVGGVVYLLLVPLFSKINRYRTLHKISRITLRISAFILVYLLVSLLVIPLLAKVAGRVPLPVFADKLKPLTISTCLLNRHYVTPKLLKSAESAGRMMSEEYPGATLRYLDAGFPFIDGFPLFPHLSHNDGKKLDLAFFYLDQNAGPTHQTPSPIGYGVFTDPLPGEINQPEICASKGYWQYGLLENVVPQHRKKDFRLDAERTRAMIKIFAAQPAIGKIFIEPHLKERLQLSSAKIRFHGCQAVRHDDHIHVQLR